MIYTLAYTSHALIDFNEPSLAEILKVSRTCNLRDGITGLLTARGQHFMQFLEGDETLVQNCFKRIKKDIRHKNVNMFCEFSSEERLMQDWSMGWVPHTESAVPLLELFDTAMTLGKVVEPVTLQAMVRLFARNSIDLVNVD